MTKVTEVQTRAEALLCRESSGERFPGFLPDHLQRAVSVAARFMELANASPGEAGLVAVLDEAERCVGQEGLGLVRYALRVFITHHPEGRRLSVPPLEERAPHQVLPSKREGPSPSGKRQAGTPGAEVWFDYFREDTGLNDFHDTWHVRYPVAGCPDPSEPRRRLTQARRGERFWYMHQQLLARYDTERLAFGVNRVVPLSDYASPIAEGYDAGLPGFSSRPPGLSPRDLPGYGVKEHATRRDRLFMAASSGLLWREDSPLVIEDVGQLADTVESNPGSVEGEDWARPLSHYGSLGNLGHVLLAQLRAPGSAELPGVLACTATAARDPLFYRWHRHVDDILDTWQCDHLPPHELPEAPRVRLRRWLGEGHIPAHQSPDIIVCLRRDIPGAQAPDFDGQRWGEDLFSGERWCSPPPAFPVTTQTLHTRLGQHPVRLPDGREVLKPRLEHEEFYCFFRVENLLPREQQVRLHVFLVADAFAEERRLWLELDSFTWTLRPSWREVIFRPSRLASVVCEGGWPSHLLLPRGRPEGMLFRMMVLVTDAAEERELGFPFNRPLPPGQRILELTTSRQDLATRNLWIHHAP